MALVSRPKNSAFEPWLERRRPGGHHYGQNENRKPNWTWRALAACVTRPALPNATPPLGAKKIERL